MKLSSTARPGAGLAIGIALVALLAGCASSGRRSPSARPPDAQIQAEVRAELEADRRVDAAAIEVASRDGIVTLSGVVADLDQVRRALRIAARVDGVTQIVNRLRVLPREPGGPATAA